jgi:hypothetical protein
MITGTTISGLGKQLFTSLKHWGVRMINNILMNTVATILFTYGKYHIEPAYQQKAVEWMSQLPAREEFSDDKIQEYRSYQQECCRFTITDRTQISVL